MLSDETKYGKVILAGAGPGDPDFITVKTMRYLQQADVVLVDRLVSNEILTAYCKPDAAIIYVGKQCKRGASTPQQTINELIVEHAAKGKLVVRLKGGDVSVFSNILDELQIIVQNQIPYEIVPGITSALGAAACTGIPLTARGYSTAVRLLTYYKSDVVADAYWQDLANTTDTLVFYMSAETVEGIIDKLIKYGIASDRHIAVIEQATTPYQQVHSAPVHQFLSLYGNKKFLSPSLVMIGKVVELHQQFAWIPNSDVQQHYFKPVANIQQTSTNNQISHVSRA